MSAEDAKFRIEQLEAHVIRMDTLLAASQAEHVRVHAELQKNPVSNGFRLIDPKTMAPE